MGFLDKIFGEKKPDFPPLGADHPAAQKIESIAPQLNSLAQQVSDPMEVVPEEDSAIIFIGHPPKKFGVALIEEGTVKNFRSLVEGMPPTNITLLSDKLRDVYQATVSEPRFVAEVGKKQVVVTPSSTVAQKVREVFSEMSAR